MTDTPTAYKLQLGATLQRLRQNAGLEREDVAAELDCTVSKVGRIERGESGVSSPELRILLDFFKVSGDERAEIEELGREARKRRTRTPYGSVIPDRFRRFFHL